MIKIKINKLYGIFNQIDFEFKKSCLIFAPNGVGKTCIAKGLKGFGDKNLKNSLEGETNINSILINEENYESTNKSIELIDSTLLDELIDDKEDVIRNFLNTKSKRKDKYKNVYANYLGLYDECIQKLRDNGIDYNPLDESRDEQEKISWIKKQLLYDGKMDNDNFKNLVQKTINWDKKHKLLTKINKDIPDIAPIIKKIKTIEKNLFNPAISIDKEIIDLIIKKKREEKFLYIEEENKQISINEAKIKIEELLEKNGLQKDILEGIQVYKEVNNYRGAKKFTKKAREEIKYALEKVEKYKKQFFGNVLINHKSRFEAFEKEDKIILDSFVEEFNELIKKLNNEILKSNKLKWKIYVKEINNFSDSTKIEIWDDDILRKTGDLNDYASSGQKRIIALILSMISTKDNSLIVFDDPISSLDLDNAHIFLDIISNLKNKIIILTHNYNLLASASKINIENFYVMDSKQNNQAIITKINGKSALIINKWLNEKTTNGEEKALILASVLREIIDNYLYSGYKEPENDTILKRLYKLKAFLENNYRHFKTFKMTFTQAKDELNQIMGNELKEILTCKEGGLSFLFEFESSKDIFNYVKNKEIKTGFISFLDYVSQKYTFALKCRFLFEEKVINNYKIQKWNNGEIKGIHRHPNYKEFSKELIDIHNQLNLLNHVNNLRWSPVIEMPLYKIKMYWDKINANSNKLLPQNN